MTPVTARSEDGLTADLIMLGDIAFARLEGGPFDGRCYPLLDGVRADLHVPIDGPAHAGSPPTVRYVLRGGRYLFASAAANPAAA